MYHGSTTDSLRAVVLTMMPAMFTPSESSDADNSVVQDKKALDAAISYLEEAIASHERISRKSLSQDAYYHALNNSLASVIAYLKGRS